MAGEGDSVLPSAISSPVGPESGGQRALSGHPQTLQRGVLVHSWGVGAPRPPEPPSLTSLVLCRHLASMSYLSSSTTSTLACRSRHRSWGTNRREEAPLSLQPPGPCLGPGPVPPDGPLSKFVTGQLSVGAVSAFRMHLFSLKSCVMEKITM